jgi:hypothetical protein
MTILATGLIALVLAVGIACGDEEAPAPTETPAPTGTPATSPTPAATPDTQISFDTLLIGQNSGLTDQEPTVLKIESQSEWEALWNNHQSIVFPTSAPPIVDFDNKILIAVFDKEEPTGGYAIEVRAIELDDGGIVVDVVRTVPGLGCVVTEALTRPFHIVVIDAVAGEPRLALTDSVTDCS